MSNLRQARTIINYGCHKKKTVICGHFLSAFKTTTLVFETNTKNVFLAL